MTATSVEVISLLHGQWLAALGASTMLGAPECAVYREQYSAALSADHVTLAIGTALEESQLAELKVRIGHRKELKLAAAAYLPLLYGGAGEHSPDTRLNDEGSFSPHAVVVTRAQQEEAEEDLTFKKSLSDSNISMPVFSNSCGVLWRALSGTSPSLASFLDAMSAAREMFAFPASFDRAWEDNRPMPFYFHEGGCNLLLLRVPNLQEETGVTVATITNRLIIMYSVNTQTIVTYHRCERDPLEKMARNWNAGAYSSFNIFDVVDAAIRISTRTYRHAVKALQERVDELEDINDMVTVVEGLTLLQKKAAVYRRCIYSAQHVMEELQANAVGLDAFIPLIVDALDTVESQMDEVIDNTASTIDMQMALDGFRASVNTKIFTYIAVVCQPIGLATGWFGMNFSNMPELGLENAYFVFIAVVLSLAVLIIIWFVVRSIRYGY